MGGTNSTGTGSVAILAQAKKSRHRVPVEKLVHILQLTASSKVGISELRYRATTPDPTPEVTPEPTPDGRARAVMRL